MKPLSASVTDSVSIQLHDLHRALTVMSGDGSEEDLLFFWDFLTQRKLKEHSDRLKEMTKQGASEQDREAVARLLEMVEKQQENLRVLQAMPPAERRQLLKTALREKLDLLEQAWKEVRGTMHPEFEKAKQRISEMETRQFRQHRLDRARRESSGPVRSLQPRVPAQSVFIGIVPFGHSGIVDDWPLLEKAVRENPDLKNIELVRVELEPGESAVDRVRQIASSYRVPGAQPTLGIALWTMPEGQVKPLEDLWPNPITTADPLLFLSILYTPEEKLPPSYKTEERPLTSYSTLFTAWASDPHSGLMAVVPGITLPEVLWKQFEETVWAQAGLEQAA